MSNWQPIETAPKDGSEVLGWCEGHVFHLIAWDGKKWLADDGFRCVPSHWQPLPKAP